MPTCAVSGGPLWFLIVAVHSCVTTLCDILHPSASPCVASLCATCMEMAQGSLTRCDWVVTQALAGMKEGPLEQVPIQDYFPAAKELSPVQFA